MRWRDSPCATPRGAGTSRCRSRPSSAACASGRWMCRTDIASPARPRFPAPSPERFARAGRFSLPSPSFDMNRDLLIIMARYPTLGKVKTRLARDIGKAGALRVYRQLLRHHLREFRRAPFAVEWRYTPARAPFRRLASRAKPQPDGNLGDRMRGLFEDGFARGYRRVVMIG